MICYASVVVVVVYTMRVTLEAQASANANVAGTARWGYSFGNLNTIVPGILLL